MLLKFSLKKSFTLAWSRVGLISVKSCHTGPHTDANADYWLLLVCTLTHIHAHTQLSNHRSPPTLQFSGLHVRRGPFSEHDALLSSLSLSLSLACSKPRPASLRCAIPGILSVAPCSCLFLMVFCSATTFSRNSLHGDISFFLNTLHFTGWPSSFSHVLATACDYYWIVALPYFILQLVCVRAVCSAWFMKVSLMTEAVELIVCKQGVSKWLSTRKWLII